MRTPHRCRFPLALAVVGIVLTSGCGFRGFIVLNVSSALEPVSEVDRVAVEFSDGGVPIIAEDVAVTGPWPLRIVVEPRESTPRELETRITGFLGPTEVTGAVITYTWKADTTTEVAVDLTP